MAAPPQIVRVGPASFELGTDFFPGMRVPVRVFGSEKLVAEMDDQVFLQAAHVATLPGIVEASFCMPDAHWGYGFPIGGVAAMDVESSVISPGGIGFDINCGMRLVATNLTWPEVQPHLRERRELSLEEPDLELLLLRLVNELVFLRDASELLLRPERVRVTQDGVARLTATLAGERIDRARHALRSDVKAATAHALWVAERSGGWQARLTLDVCAEGRDPEAGGPPGSDTVLAPIRRSRSERREAAGDGLTANSRPVASSRNASAGIDTRSSFSSCVTSKSRCRSTGQSIIRADTWGTPPVVAGQRTRPRGFLTSARAHQP